MQRVKIKEESEGYYRRQPVEVFSSGCALFDCVLGGGWALGRVVNIVGDKSTGKTLLAIEAAANFVRKFPDGKIFYNEVEAAFDAVYAERMGLPLASTEFIEGCVSVEDVFEDLEKRLAEHTGRSLYILDSLDALSDRKELEGKIDQASFGVGKAKAMSQMFRRLVQLMADKKMTVVVISQVRTNIGVTFGSSITRSGGRALDFYASQIVYLSQIKQLVRTKHKVERTVGIRIRAKCKKNKVGAAFRECDMPIMFYYGIDDITAHLEFLEEIKALDGLGYGADAKTVWKFLLGLSDADYTAMKDFLADTVIMKWQEIEKEFTPEKAKYE